MKNITEQVKRRIMAISYQERKRKELIRYRQEIKRFRNMEDDEIDLEYINLKSLYEHKKNVLSIFIVTILISALMEAWKYFYKFIERILQFATLSHGSESEMAKAVFAITVIMIMFVTIIVFSALFLHMRRMHHIYIKLITIEEIRNGCNLTN